MRKIKEATWEEKWSKKEKKTYQWTTSIDTIQTLALLQDNPQNSVFLKEASSWEKIAATHILTNFIKQLKANPQDITIQWAHQKDFQI